MKTSFLMKRSILAIGMTSLLLLAAAISNQRPNIQTTSENNRINQQAANTNSNQPMFSHEIVIMLENKSYSEVIGNSSAPFINYLADNYGLAANYYANTHPSIGNYMMLTTGQITTNNDNFTGLLSVNNIASTLESYGKTWKTYAENLPDNLSKAENSGNYLPRHNPFQYFDEVVNNPLFRKNIVSFSEFKRDLNSGALPNFSFVVPNSCDDAHDCALSAADSWLKQNIGPVISDPDFMKDGLVVVLFDESEESDKANGGGRIPVVLAGEKIKSNYISYRFYQHQDMLRTLLDGLGVDSYPGLSATANDMKDFFKF